MCVDIGVPSLLEGLVLYRDIFELDVLGEPVDSKMGRCQLLGVGSEPCLRLFEETDPSRSALGCQRLSLITDDITVLRRRLTRANITPVDTDDGILIAADDALGVAIELAEGKYVQQSPTRPTRAHRIFSRFASADVNVPNIEQALEFYCDTLGMTQLTDALPGYKGYARTAKVGIGERSAIGLIQPTGPGPTLKRVEKAGYGFQQLGFLTDNLELTVGTLRDRGLKVVIEEADWGDIPNEPGPQTVEAFVHPRSALGVLVQFLRTSHFVTQNHYVHPRRIVSDAI